MDTELQLQLNTYVRVKYPIIERDSKTWVYVKSYPIEVVDSWAWSCALDVAHLAKKYDETKQCIVVANAYRNGKATRRELSDAAHVANSIISPSTANAVNAAYSAYYAAYYGKLCEQQVVYSAYYAATHAPTHHAKFNLYTKWLVDALVQWESANFEL